MIGPLFVKNFLLVDKLQNCRFFVKKNFIQNSFFYKNHKLLLLFNISP